MKYYSNSDGTIDGNNGKYNSAGVTKSWNKVTNNSKTESMNESDNVKM